MLWLLAFILLSGTVSFTAGVLLPLLQLDRLYFFTETPSLLQIIVGLLQEGDVLLGLLVAGFSL
ncbi:MAG: paraquat-inducible protein A, partial [Rhizobiales bacterium]|nr:paraquat-inducible protein A [Hyphomicrobiales bacterium]